MTKFENSEKQTFGEGRVPLNHRSQKPTEIKIEPLTLK